MITSPGQSVTSVESWAICSAVLKIILLVLESCIRSSFTQSFNARFCGSRTSLAGTIQGPIGHEPSKHFCMSQSSLKGDESGT